MEHRARRRHPRYPRGYFSSGDAVAYRDLILSLSKNAVVVEVGTYRGRSICMISEQLQQVDAQVFLIDSFIGARPNDPTVVTTCPACGQVRKSFVEDPEEIKNDLERNLVKFKLASRCRLIESDSTVAARSFGVESVDLVFIDDDHSFDGVTSSVEAWWPKVRMNGTISGHDYRKTGVYGHQSVREAVHAFFGSPTLIQKNTRQNQNQVWYVHKSVDNVDAVNRVKHDSIH